MSNHIKVSLRFWFNLFDDCDEAIELVEVAAVLIFALTALMVLIGVPLKYLGAPIWLSVGSPVYVLISGPYWLPKLREWVENG